MKKLNCAIAAILVLATASARADIVVLSPSDINMGDTNTATFSNSFITLTPTIGGIAATFNGDAVRLGIDDRAGTNANAFGGNGAAGYNTTFGDADDEGLILAFSSSGGFAGISWDFSRAFTGGAANPGGAITDGVQFTGFLSDPGATLGGEDPTAFDTTSVSYSGGVLTLLIPGTDFTGLDANLVFSNTAATLGQTITMTVADSGQAGAQFAVTSISYDNAAVAVPEPTSFAILALGMIGLATRRRRS